VSWTEEQKRGPERRKRAFMNRKIWAGRRGQALVEFAMVLPLVLVILLGIVEFGFILYNQHVITNASREGARYGIVAGSPRRSLIEIEGVVDAYCAGHMITFGIGIPDIKMVEPEDPGTAGFGDNLTIEVTFPYDFLVLPNFLASLTGFQELNAHTTMKYE